MRLASKYPCNEKLNQPDSIFTTSAYYCLVVRGNVLFVHIIYSTWVVKLFLFCIKQSNAFSNNQEENGEQVSIKTKSTSIPTFRLWLAITEQAASQKVRQISSAPAESQKTCNPFLQSWYYKSTYQFFCTFLMENTFDDVTNENTYFTSWKVACCAWKALRMALRAHQFLP